MFHGSKIVCVQPSTCLALWLFGSLPGFKQCCVCRWPSRASQHRGIAAPQHRIWHLCSALGGLMQGQSLRSCT